MKNEDPTGRTGARGVRRIGALVCAAGLLAGSAAFGDATAPAHAESGASPEATPLRRETPRSTMEGYLSASRAGDFERAAAYLDTSRIAARGARPADAARQLKVVLDRKLWVDLDALSDDATGRLDDGLPQDIERVGSVASAQGNVEVRLVRRALPDGSRIWLVDPMLVARVEALYAEHGYGWLGEILPEPLLAVRVLELALWQWLGLMLLLVLASTLGYVVTWLVLRIVMRALRQLRGAASRLQAQIVAGPARLIVSVLIFYAGCLTLALPLPAQQNLAAACRALVLVGAGWLALRVVDVLAGYAQDRLAERTETVADTVVPMGRRISKAFVLAIAGVAIVDNLGFNVAGLLAGLGVGGLAVALAAQKTLENLFGGFTLIADRPVTVGQFCRVGDHVGTVEDIGLRSTRIRTLDRTLVTVPNAEISTTRIENFAVRDKMRLYAVLQVGYDTSPDQMRYLLVELRKMLYAHPKTLPDPCRVRFVNLGAYSLDLEIFVFIDTRDWNDFMAVREDIYLRVMDIVSASGASFAYPSQTLYLGRDEGRNATRTQEAEAEVRRLRDAGALPLPEFPAEQIEQIDDSLEYPPPGSALARG
ncbi:MAG: mechanosensitive ion channel family protein [Myxococcales bacterium]|nr:mechanosensitive ion channel family protein [Myxococcales bacterium]MDH5305899.1 mechanosensitive ion channel family protein [Myxococcales bacterium]MDH5566019.1 mechanosensitive ion channel family protein [Myxococcales bacterium]